MYNKLYAITKWLCTCEHATSWYSKTLKSLIPRHVHIDDILAVYLTRYTASCTHSHTVCNMRWCPASRWSLSQQSSQPHFHTKCPQRPILLPHSMHYREWTVSTFFCWCCCFLLGQKWMLTYNVLYIIVTDNLTMFLCVDMIFFHAKSVSPSIHSLLYTHTHSKLILGNDTNQIWVCFEIIIKTIITRTSFELLDIYSTWKIKLILSQKNYTLQQLFHFCKIVGSSWFVCGHILPKTSLYSKTNLNFCPIS